jgi:two-component system, LuxR family, response regulator FixJ
MTERMLVHVIDDEETVRRSIAFLLKTSGYTVALWDSGVTFLREARHAEPGVALLDVRMPDMDGLDVQDQMARQGTTMPVIVLTGHGDISQAVRAMRAGAIDFLEKPFDREKLLQALNTAFRQLRDAAARSAMTSDAQSRIAALTLREREVLAGLACGFPNKTIAYDLGISPRTVEVHRANLMTKLKVGNFADALRIAFAAGLGQDGDWRDIVEGYRVV